MKKPELHMSLMNILPALMASRGVKVRDIVKATGFPQPTISNILSGKSKNPNINLLKALADLFGITLGQLVGYETLKTRYSFIPSNNPSNLTQKESAPLVIPLLQWNEIQSWLSNVSATKVYPLWVANDICKSPKAFALNSKSSMRSYLFSEKVTLLINPQETLHDGLVVLVFLNESKEPSLRLFSTDGDQKKLQALEQESPAVLLSPKDLIIGPIVEVRHSPSLNGNKQVFIIP